MARQRAEWEECWRCKKHLPDEADRVRDEPFTYCSAACRDQTNREYDAYVDPLGAYAKYPNFIKTHD